MRLVHLPGVNPLPRLLFSGFEVAFSSPARGVRRLLSERYSGPITTKDSTLHALIDKSVVRGALLGLALCRLGTTVSFTSTDPSFCSLQLCLDGL